MQLLGVLREVVAERTAGTALTSAASVLFEAPAVTSEALDWHELPALRAGRERPAGPVAEQHRRGRSGDPARRAAAGARGLARGLAGPGPRGAGMRRHDLVDQVVNAMLAEDPWEWRAVWMSGLVALDAGDFGDAQSAFNAVYGQVPGELAPSWRSRSPARPAARPTSPRRSTSPVPAPTPTTSRRPRSAWPGSAPPAATSTARSRRSTSCRRPAGASPRPGGCGRSCSTSRAGGCASLAEAMDSLDGVRLDPRDRRSSRWRCWSVPWPGSSSRDRRPD